MLYEVTVCHCRAPVDEFPTRPNWYRVVVPPPDAIFSIRPISFAPLSNARLHDHVVVANAGAAGVMTSPTRPKTNAVTRVSAPRRRRRPFASSRLNRCEYIR